MAGAGFRDFVAGDQLTADQVDQFLMQQTVMRFANAAARTSGIGAALSEGMVSYLDDTNLISVYNGTDWVAVAPPISAATPLVAGSLFGKMGTDFGPNSSNIALGYNSGTSLTEAGPGRLGKNNVVLGTDTAKNLSTGYGNTVIGPGAGAALTTGRFNVAIGQGALNLVTTATSNTALGTGAGQSIAGAGNTAIGDSAFAGQLVSGNNNTALGHLAGVFSSNTLSGGNNTLVGYQAASSTNTANNEITLGNSSNTVLRCNVTSITSLSDARDKTDIEDLSVGLDFINLLRPVQFTWDTRAETPIELPSGEIIEPPRGRVGVPDMGLIAQDMVTAEDSVSGHDWLQLTLRDNPEKLEVTQGRLIPILVKAIQELSAEVSALKAIG